MRSLLLRQPYERQVLVLYIAAVAMTVIDTTMVNVALPAIGDEFGIAANEAEWVALGYVLAVAAVIPAAGWMGDRFGTKRVFLVGLSAFTAVSLVCGLARSLDQLVAARVAQGLGGGLILPIGSAMLFRAFPLHRRAVAAAAVLSVAVLAPATGPLLGGILVDQASWRWMFFVNIPIGTVVVLLGWSALREEVHDAPGRLDIAGLVSASAAVTLLLAAVSLGPERGWWSPLVVTLFASGGAIAVAAVAIELHVAEPALALRLFRDRVFRDVNLSATFLYVGFFGLLFVLPIYVQQLRGESATTSGLVQAPQAIGVLTVSVLFGQRAYRAIGPRRLLGVFGFVAAAFTAGFGLVGVDTPLWVLAASLFGRGLAMGLVFISIQTAVYATTSIADTGRATSLFSTQRQISVALGTSVGATVVTAGRSGLPGDAPPADRLPAYRWAFVVLGVWMMIGALTAWRLDDDDVAATRRHPA